MTTYTKLLWLATSLGLAVGCSPTEVADDAPACEGDQVCEGLNTAEVTKRLNGRKDAIANWLRTSDAAKNELSTLKDDAGTDQKVLTATINFEKIWTGIGAKMGCAKTSLKTYTVSDDVLTPGKPFPRVIGVVCDDDVTKKASEVFISAPFPTQNQKDIDVERLEMFAWDDAAQTYRFYATQPLGGGKVAVEVEPTRCQGCHLTPVDTDAKHMRMTPIMNELSAPWPHWNASPDFESRDFHVPPQLFSVKPGEARTASSPPPTNYEKLTTAARQSSAPRFQAILRRGAYPRVERARVADRNLPADVDRAMGLLRPLFCEEQINYVSEDANAISTEALVESGGMRPLYVQQLGLEGQWLWIGEPSVLALKARDANEPETFMVPVRGEADIQVEEQLVALGVLRATDVLRIHALDWKRPIFSDFRCGLWKSAKQRFTAADAAGVKTTGELVRKLFPLVMSIDGTSLLVAGSATDPTSEKLLVVPDAKAAGMDAQILARAGASGASCEVACLATARGFGALVSNEVLQYDDVERLGRNGADPESRKHLAQLRDERVAHALEDISVDGKEPTHRFGAAPSLK